MSAGHSDTVPAMLSKKSRSDRPAAADASAGTITLTFVPSGNGCGLSTTIEPFKTTPSNSMIALLRMTARRYSIAMHPSALLQFLVVHLHGHAFGFVFTPARRD